MKVHKILKVQVPNSEKQYFECKFEDGELLQNFEKEIENKEFVFKDLIIKFEISNKNHMRTLLNQSKSQDFYSSINCEHYVTLSNNLPAKNTNDEVLEAAPPPAEVIVSEESEESVEEEYAVFRNVNWVKIGSDSSDDERELIYEKILDHSDDNIRYNL